MTGRLLLLFTLLATASAQINVGSASIGGRVRVWAVSEDHATCESTTRVALVASAGLTFAENSVNEQCVAEFFDVPEGNYRVKVTGPDLANFGETQITVSSGMAQDVEVQSRRKGNGGVPVNGASAFVSVGELGIPSAAKKEFDKANRLISKQEWSKATELLRKAVAIYPQYADAYNNLGAIYRRLGDVGQAREVLQKAVAINDHLAVAYVNLGRLSFDQKDFAGVEAFIGKALTVGSPDGGELTMLAYAQVADRHLEEAIATAGTAHRSQLANHAFAHVLAAKADEMQGKDADSEAELQKFLKEEPTGRRAEQVKNVLAKLESGRGPR